MTRLLELENSGRSLANIDVYPVGGSASTAKQHQEQQRQKQQRQEQQRSEMADKQNNKPTAGEPSALALAEIQARIAAIEAGSVSATASRSLSAEYKSIHGKHGKREFQKPCGGPRVCKNTLCNHKYSLAKPTTSADTGSKGKTFVVNEVLLDGAFKKLEKDGYLVTKDFVEQWFTKSQGNMPATIKAVKDNIDAREKKLIESGRVSLRWEKSHATTDTRDPDTMVGTSSTSRYALPMQRDQLLQVVEREDFTVREVGTKGWNSFFGQEILNSRVYKETTSMDHAYSMYYIEAKFRAARAEVWKKLKTERPRATMDSLLDAIDEWDRMHAEAEGNHFFSPFRRIATGTKAKRENEAKYGTSDRSRGPYFESLLRDLDAASDAGVVDFNNLTIAGGSSGPSSCDAKGKGKAVDKETENVESSATTDSSSVPPIFQKSSAQLNIETEVARLRGPLTGDPELDAMLTKDAEEKVKVRKLQEQLEKITAQNTALKQEQIAIRAGRAMDFAFESKEDLPWDDNIEDIDVVLKDLENVEEQYYFIDDEGDRSCKVAILGRVLLSLRETIVECNRVLTAGHHSKTAMELMNKILYTLRSKKLIQLLRNAFDEEDHIVDFDEDMKADLKACLFYAEEFDYRVEQFPYPLAYPEQWAHIIPVEHLKDIRKVSSFLRSIVILLADAIDIFSKTYPRGEAALDELYTTPKPVGVSIEQHIRDDMVRLFDDTGKAHWYFDVQTKEAWDHLIIRAKAIDCINRTYPTESVFNTLPDDDDEAVVIMKTAISLKSLPDKKELHGFLIDNGDYPKTAEFVAKVIKDHEEKDAVQAAHAKDVAAASAAGSSGSATLKPKRRLLITVPSNESAIFDRTPTSDPQIKDNLGIWTVEFVYLSLALNDLRVEITGGFIETGPFSVDDVEYVKTHGGIITDSAAKMILTLCSGMAVLGVAYWNKAQPVIRKHIVKRGDKEICNSSDELVLMRFGAAVVASRLDELLEKESAEEQLLRNNPKALAKLEKKADKKAAKKAAKKAGKR